MANIRFSVSDFVALTNQTLEYAYPVVEIIGEVQSFKVNQDKYVFFDLKDQSASVGCFMTVWQLKMPIEDGMKVLIAATPKLTNWGKFSLTVKTISPLGEGSIKRSYEMLIQKLDKEGLFDDSRKRSLPRMPDRVGVIASTESAGYADFIKIINERWGGINIEVAHVQVQGDVASEQIINALKYFDESAQPPEVVVIMRGGGSANDLNVFNDESLVRAIAGSRAPVLTGIGHETDTTIADMVADKRAATPSNAAQMLVPDKIEIINTLKHKLGDGLRTVGEHQAALTIHLKQRLLDISNKVSLQVANDENQVEMLRNTLLQLNPETVLQRGYAIVRRENGRLVDQNVSAGEEIRIEMKKFIIHAGVNNVSKK